MQFSQEQLNVISLNDGYHTCLASAGAGKTEILTERIYQALQSGQYQPREMLSLTFTNQAAISMQTRVANKLEDKFPHDLFIGNIHTLGIKLLGKNHFPRGFSLVDEDTAAKLWSLVKTQFTHLLHNNLNEFPELIINGDDSAIEEALTLIFQECAQTTAALGVQPQFSKYDMNVLKNALAHIHRDLEGNVNQYKSLDFRNIYRLVQPFRYIPDLPNDFMLFTHDRLIVSISEMTGPQLEQFGAAIICSTIMGILYDKLKAELSVYDFDDVLVNMLKLPNQGYKWLNVDETQDISPIHWLIIKHVLVSNDSHTLLLGDLNQSIYRFLGASIENTTEQLGSNIHKLTMNYRSPSNLVSFFNDYCREHFPAQHIINAQAINPPEPNSLLVVHENDSNSVISKCINHIVNDSNEASSALLCRTNAQVNDIHFELEKAGIKHFRVSAEDLMQSENAMDFLCFIRSYIDKYDVLAWSRMLWRFGTTTKGEMYPGFELPPQLFALHVNVELAKKGLNLKDILGQSNIFNHYLKRFQSAVEDEYNYFDTETTGLNFNHDNVIQVAAVKDGAKCEYQEVDLYCLSNMSVGDSEKIHKISDAILQEYGKPFKAQTDAFLAFCDGSPLIAHNMPFDLHMMASNIQRYGGNIDDFKALDKFCTLELTKQLFPDLGSYKLESLLKEFKLQGVNSHNAIDDVRSGSNLAKFLAKHTAENIEQIDSLIDKHFANLNRFNNKFADLFSKMDAYLYSGENIDLMTIFDLYIEHVMEHKPYTLKTDNIQELRSKLENWSKTNFKSDIISRYLPRIHKNLLTLKESDLITSTDKVVVSTIHRAKGLEFDNIYMPFVSNNEFPPFFVGKIINDEERKQAIDESKRLLYVGITRAKKRLIIGCSEFNDYGYRISISHYVSDLIRKQFKRI